MLFTPASALEVTVRTEPSSYLDTYERHHIPCQDGKLLYNYPRTFTLTFCFKSNSFTGSITPRSNLTLNRIESSRDWPKARTTGHTGYTEVVYIPLTTHEWTTQGHFVCNHYLYTQDIFIISNKLHPLNTHQTLLFLNPGAPNGWNHLHHPSRPAFLHEEFPKLIYTVAQTQVVFVWPRMV